MLARLCAFAVGNEAAALMTVTSFPEPGDSTRLASAKAMVALATRIARAKAATVVTVAQKLRIANHDLD